MIVRDPRLRNFRDVEWERRGRIFIPRRRLVEPERAIHGAPFPGGGLVTIAFQANSGGAVAVGSPQSFTLSFGPEAPNRYLIAVIPFFCTGSNVLSCTIGGVSATKAAEFSGGNPRSSIWAALVPTGTSGTVTFTFSGSADAGCAVYSMTGNALITPSSIIQAASSGTIAIPSGGAAVGASSIGSNTTITWTGLTKDFQISYINPQGSGASSRVPQTGNVAVTSNGAALAVAAWGP